MDMHIEDYSHSGMPVGERTRDVPGSIFYRVPSTGY